VVGIVGPAVKEMSDNVHIRNTEFGPAFTTRGLGYLIGASIVPFIKIDLHKKFALGGFIYVITCVWITYIDNFFYLCILLLINAIGSGIIDTLANTLILYVHGKDVDPWMQALHCFFGKFS
jgi:fucose permease